MKSKIFTLVTLAFLGLSNVYSHVGIGTTSPDASAILELDATNKGLLIPRVALTSNADVTTIPTPATSLMVYNDASGGLTPAGYYYYNGTLWVSVAPTVSSDTVGDIKTGVQAADHNGWVLLNGRAVGTLTASQQANAVLLGFATNLPDASNAYPSQNGTASDSVSGSNTKTLTQSNLPNFNMTGSTSTTGAHNHNYNNSSANVFIGSFSGGPSGINLAIGSQTHQT